MLGHELILKMGNPILREVSKPLLKEEIVSDHYKDLVKKMWEVMEQAGGIGLAAPQIGVLKQLAVIRLDSNSERYENIEDSEEFVIFNPKLEY